MLDRPGQTVAVEPYGPNIVRITISKSHEEAVAAPGYGFLAPPAPSGWSSAFDSTGNSSSAVTLSSSRLHVRVFGRATDPGRPPLRTQKDIARYFGGSAPGAHITVSTLTGKTLVELTGWAMAEPNYKDGTANVLHEKPD